LSHTSPGKKYQLEIVMRPVDFQVIHIMFTANDM
jgi:hypothetical protein